jgi:PAS domain S-box-containing protein
VSDPFVAPSAQTPGTLLEAIARLTGARTAAIFGLDSAGGPPRISERVAAWGEAAEGPSGAGLDDGSLAALAAGGILEVAAGVRWVPVPGDGAQRFVLALGTGTDRTVGSDGEEARLRAAATLVGLALDRGAAESALVESEAKYREMFENATELFWSIDLEGRFTSVNRAFTEVLGFAVDEMIGHSWEEFIPEPEQREIVRGAMREKLEARREQTRYEVRMRRKGGGHVPVEVSSRLVRRGGRPVGIHGVGRDVSEPRRLEEQLRQAVKMEAVGRLAGGIAHEFSHLVAAISGYGERILARLKPADPLRAEVSEILRAGERAADLTRELLAFGRQQSARPARLDLNEFIQQRLPTLRRIVSEEVVVVDLIEERVGRIHADPGLLEQLLVSLFVNARDAMPEGGRIEISTATADAEEIRRRGLRGVPRPTYVRLSIRDSGEGMDPATMSRIFEPFFTTRERGRGSGLGLSTVYGIVKQCEGFIFADSHPGQGSVFHVYLPQVEAPGRRRPPSGEIRIAAVTAPSAARPELVLLVEDEELIRSLAEQILADRGYRVIPASNASEALEIVSRLDREPDLLVTDVVMPGLSGLDLAQRLQRRSPRLRILFMSGYADSPLLRAGLAQGGAAFLQKPFSADALERRVRELLDGPPPAV